MTVFGRRYDICLIGFGVLLFAGPGASQSIYSAVDPNCDYTDAERWGGWGWNPVALVSCPPVVATTDCDYSSADIYAGYGWNPVTRQSCPPLDEPIVEPGPVVVTESSCDYSNASMHKGYGWNPVSKESCPPEESDVSPDYKGVCDYSEADMWAGFGWNPVTQESCPPLEVENDDEPVVAGPVVIAPAACIDTDGDGYGWRDPPGESCRIATPKLAPVATNSVTDVILMMGQSNALGEGTQVDYTGVDAPNAQVLAWTAQDGWQVADLCNQIWQNSWYPARGGLCSNHPGFQIAKNIVAQDPARVVALIPTGTGGKPISWWDEGTVGEQQVFTTVDEALAELETPEPVRLIAWSQGESDSGNEQAWAIKLKELIKRLRGQDWFNESSGIFIAQETKKSSVNSEVRALADDGDPLTRWVPAADLRVKDGVHWSAEALRTIGERFATEYLK